MSSKSTRGETAEIQIPDLGPFDLKSLALAACFHASSGIGCVLLPKQAVLLRILVGSPLAGKCLSTEQVVASILPDNAPAQTRVLEALCRGRDQVRDADFRQKARAEQQSLCLPLAFSAWVLILAVLTSCLLDLFCKQTEVTVNKRGGAGLQSRVDLSFNTSPGSYSDV